MTAFVDANVILRYLLNDVPDMAERAAQILDNSPDLALTDAVLAEVAYVLMRQYGIPRSAIVDDLIALIQKPNIGVWRLDKDTVIRALLLCRPSARVSFTDAMLWASARSAGATIVYSFDERFPSDGIAVRQEP
jgi:predicted nucleic acid-binding protein